MMTGCSLRCLRLRELRPDFPDLTVLKKREDYRKAFDGFDVKKVASCDELKIARLLDDAGIIRNTLKIRSSAQNAKAFIAIQEDLGSLDKDIWSFVGDKPIANRFRSLNELPAKTELSDRISRDLKKRSMSFVGSTIIYASMQAIGMVNDHQTDCFRHDSS